MDLETVRQPSGRSRIAARFLAGAWLVLFPAISSNAEKISTNKPLSTEDKIYGLSLIWKEASYNFAHFDLVPDLDWDGSYQRFIPKVISAGSIVEYYDLLKRFCAQLHDGHTRIFPPDEYRRYHDKPNVLVLNIQRGAIIAAAGESLKSDIPVGSRIIEVDGTPTGDYLRTKRFPFICGSTEDFLWEVGILNLLKGQKGTAVTIKCLTPAGETLEMRLERNSTDLDERIVNTYPRTDQRLEFRWLENNIAYIALNSFSDPGIISDFERILPELRKRKSVIIDLRRNGGGESDIGYSILRYLVDRPVPTFTWKTREHRAAYKAWGKWTSEFPPEELDNLDEKRTEYLKHYRGIAWYEGKQDTVHPASESDASTPIAVLIGPLTASAAEDFLAAMDSFDEAVFIGRRTAGFTGTPLIFDLPGGGSALINTTIEMFPDGAEIRDGIKPDIEIESGVQDIMEGKDAVLEYAISLLNEKAK